MASRAADTTETFEPDSALQSWNPTDGSADVPAAVAHDHGMPSDAGHVDDLGAAASLVQLPPTPTASPFASPPEDMSRAAACANVGCSFTDELRIPAGSVPVHLRRCPMCRGPLMYI